MKAFTLIVYKNFYGDNDLINTFTAKSESSIIDIVKYAEGRVSELDKGSVKVFDVDTPIQIPFSLGDMKSKVSLYNIETVGMIFMPVLLVIWLGSISMTRTREVYYIKKTKNIADSYPHILNLYYFIDKDILEKQDDISNFNKIVASDITTVKSNRPLAIIYFLFRITIVSLLSLAIIAPFYLGAYKVIDSLSVSNVIGIVLCLIINTIQSITLIGSETLLFKTIFTAEGTTNDCI